MLKAIDYIFAARPLLHLPVWSVYLVVARPIPSLGGGAYDVCTNTRLVSAKLHRGRSILP